MRAPVVMVAAVVVLAVSGYAAADLADVAPGVLTTDPMPPDVVPFPDAPGAAALPSAPAPTEAGEPPVPDGAALTARLRAAMTPSPGTDLGPDYSVSVTDATTGEVLADLNANRPTQPASVTKLMTAAAALHELGPRWRSTTSAYVGDDGTVILAGGGDHLLDNGDGNDRETVGHAGLADLAQQTAKALKQQGTTSVRVALSDAAFPGPTWSEGWAVGDASAGYVAPVTSLAVDAGRVRPGKYAPRHTDPGLAAAKQFAAALTAAGVSVTGTPERTPTAPAGDPVAQVRSAPLEDVVTYVLRTSDNTVAEGLARHVALSRAGGAKKPVDFATAAKAVVETVAELGVDVGEIQLADGSGLGKGSLISGRAVTSVLSQGSSTDHPGLRALVTGLPVAGLQGTLEDRFDKSPRARGVARAKTGTLNGVTALAGTVRDADGRLLSFAFLADAVPSMTSGRLATDAMVGALAECGCQRSP